MTPFRQSILPGDVGSDVTSVKRAYVKMAVAGSGALAITKTAGTQFVAVTKTVQRQHGLPVTGVYNGATHKIVAPHFDAYGVTIYRAAAIRKRPAPPPPTGDARTLAQRLLASDSYHADNPADLRDLQSTAKGEAVWSQAGRWVHIDPRPLRLLCWLIDEGYKIGTFAICSDHSNDGPDGHAGGYAVDVSSINGVSVAAHTARVVTLELATAIHAAPAGLRPRQLICGGYGNVRDSAISALSIPAADSYYGSFVMQEHTNHVHCGF